MTIPDWWQLTLIALAVFRIYRLIAEDTILEGVRRWVYRLDRNWQKEGDYTGDKYRVKLALFVTCPWCLGFWLSLAWWGAYQVWEHGAVVVAAPWAISAIVALVAKNLDKEEE